MAFKLLRRARRTAKIKLLASHNSPPSTSSKRDIYPTIQRYKQFYQHYWHRAPLGLFQL
jgi:hypothetical protein